jgi:selenocysteine lyase/cysteine desulfurase
VTVLDLAALAAPPNALAPHYARFRLDERVLLSGHSHQAWPDVAREGLVEAFDDAALLVDDKWDRAEAKADEVRAGYRRLLHDPQGAIALSESTHHLIVKFLSGLDLAAGRPRLVTTDGEFHSLRRQLDRLAEAGVEVAKVSAEPVDTLAERLGAATDDHTAAVLVSAVLFESARIVPHLGELAAVCRRRGAELLVDAYHALGPVPFPLHDLGLADAWVTGGGYKYLQLGEGNAFLRVPAHGLAMRPVVTGWFAEFTTLSDAHDPAVVTYAPGPQRFAGGTYDPASHYRGARVFAFFAEHGLTTDLLRESYRHQVEVLAGAFDALDAPEEVVSRDRRAPLDAYGGFVALRSPHAARLRDDLRVRGVFVDSRADVLRIGPAPYLSDDRLADGIAALADAVAALNAAGARSPGPG